MKWEKQWCVCGQIISVCNSKELLQEAQLSQRDRATLRVTEYFTKSLKLTQGHSKWHCTVEYGTCKSLLVFHWSYVYILRYSAGKNGVTLKAGQGHWKRRRSIDHLYDFRLVGHSSMLYHFRVIWRWIMVTLKYRSLKVIQTGTIRKLWCGFLFAFHSNYGSILHRLRDKARYW